MKYIYKFFILIAIYSCSDSQCGLPNYENTRNVEINLNKDAEKALNKITSILTKGRYLKNVLQDARVENEIYFNLNEEDNILHQ